LGELVDEHPPTDMDLLNRFFKLSCKSYTRCRACAYNRPWRGCGRRNRAVFYRPVRKRRSNRRSCRSRSAPVPYHWRWRKWGGAPPSREAI